MDNLNVKKIVEKLKEVKKVSNKDSVPTSTYDNFLFYLESQELRQNIIKDDANNVFRAVSDALEQGQLTFSPVKEKLIEKLKNSQNQLKHLWEQYLDIEPEEYIDQTKNGSVDPMIDLAFILQVYQKNLRLFYFHKDSSLIEIKLPAWGQDAEYICLFYFHKMFHTIKDDSQKVEETKIDLSGYRKKKIQKEDSDKDEEEAPQDVTFGQSISKSKSSIFTGEVKGLSSEGKKPNNLGKRDTYKKKGMSSTSSAFIPPNKLKFADPKVFSFIS
jgi:hypothetical protein